MKITFEFDNIEEARPILALYGAGLVPTPVGGAPEAPRRRRTKAEMAADAAAAATPAPTPRAPAPEPLEPAGSDWDEDEPLPPVRLTKDDVRAALVAYQTRSTQEKAQALLKAVGGVEKLGALPEGKFAEVIKAAETAK